MLLSFVFIVNVNRLREGNIHNIYFNIITQALTRAQWFKHWADAAPGLDALTLFLLKGRQAFPFSI